MVKTYRIFTGAPSFSLNASKSVDEISTAYSIPDNQNQSYFLQTTTLDDDESHVTEEQSVGNKSGYKSFLRGNNDSMISFLRVDNKTGDRTNDSYEGSTMLSEGSSISRFPTFNFNVDNVTNLSSLMSIVRNQKPTLMKVNTLVIILEVDGPVYVTSKNQNNPEEMALLKLMICNQGGHICKLVVWRETAEIWGGLSPDISPTALKRGDVVYFENIVLNSAAVLRGTSEMIELVASPSHKSSAQICYRTNATVKEDMAFRPDLRLAHSIPSVRMVSEVVAWMESAGYT